MGFTGEPVFLDYETYSEADLKAVGGHNYALHPSTDLLCLASKQRGSQDTHLWLPDPALFDYLFEQEPPGVVFDRGDVPVLIEHGTTENLEFHAWHSEFERDISKFVAMPVFGWPRISDAQWRCTMAKASYSGLARKLDSVCKQLEMGDDGKDEAGHKIMLKLSKPRRKKDSPRWTPQDVPDDFRRLYAYCCQDVRVEERIDGFCEPWPEKERYLWQIDCLVNRRGVPVDVELCRSVAAVLAEAQRRATADMEAVIGIEGVKPTQIQLIKDYIAEKGIELALGKKGEPSLDEQALEEMLSWDLPSDVRDLLKARRSVSFSSVAKFTKALNQRQPDARVRNQFVYGAAVTMRYAGKGVQFHNLKRASISDEALQAIFTRDCDEVAKHGEPLEVLSEAARAMIKAPPGREIAAPDFSGVEARITYWFAGDTKTLHKFASGEDLYIDFAAEHVYQMPVEEISHFSEEAGKRVILPEHKDKRSIGKCGILGLGFMMGADKFVKSVFDITGLTIDNQFAKSVVGTYRKAFPDVAAMWRDLQRASIICTQTGQEVVGRKWKFSLHREWLVQHLPSGRCMYYFRPRVVDGMYGKEVQYQGPRGKKTLSPSVLIENLVQATARDLEADAIVRLWHSGIDVFGHVHDSILTEVPAGDSAHVERIEAIMSVVPKWAEGLPVGVESKVGPRFS